MSYCADVRCTKLFLKYKADVNIGTIVHTGCAKNFEIAKLLIANGANVNARDSEGNTPLFYANHRNVVELLIKNGADVNARNFEGKTPLFRCANREIAELLIKNGAEVKVKNLKGETAIFYDHTAGRASLFLKYKIRVNEQDNDGRTALHYILKNETYYTDDTILQLLKGGAKVDIKDKDGITSLDIAKDLADKENYSNIFINKKKIYDTMLKYK